MSEHYSNTVAVRLSLFCTEAVEGICLACSPSVSACRKDWLWKLQSNSCNYLQSVDNQGPAEKTAHTQTWLEGEASRATEGKTSQKEIKEKWQRCSFQKTSREAAVQVNTNQTRKWQVQRVVSLKLSPSYTASHFQQKHLFFKVSTPKSFCFKGIKSHTEMLQTLFPFILSNL